LHKENESGAGASPKAFLGEIESRSWFTPARLLDLFFDPCAFFARRSNIDFTPAIATAVVLAACVEVMDKIEQKALLLQAGLANEGTQAMVGWMTESWTHYWLCVLGIGLLGTAISWYVQGWWYGLRLRWSGPANVSFPLARRVTALHQLVVALPTLAIVLSETARFDDYRAALSDDSLWLTTAMPLVFLAWSCWVSYCAATTLFPAARIRGWLWFLVLPLAAYGLANLGMIAYFLRRS
jgi:hypothetical protein